MSVRSLVRTAAVAALVAALAPTAARSQVFNFGAMNGVGNLGTSEVFTLLGYGSVTATASTGWVLWAKSDGYGETGLGLCANGHVTHHVGRADTCNNDREIGNGGGFLTLDMSGLLAGVTPVGFELSSVQNGEHYSYQSGSSCGSLGAGGSGSTPNDGNATSNGTQAGGGNANPFLWGALASTTRCLEFDPVASYSDERTYYNNGDYSVMSLVVKGDPSVVPEPATMTLMAMGLVGMAGASFRRRRTAA